MQNKRIVGSGGISTAGTDHNTQHQQSPATTSSGHDHFAGNRAGENPHPPQGQEGGHQTETRLSQGRIILYCISSWIRKVCF